MQALERDADATGEVELVAHRRAVVRVGPRELKKEERAVDAKVLIERIRPPRIDEIELERELHSPAKTVAAAGA